MKLFDHFRTLTPTQRRTFIACFLGWSLDAFDFFIMVWCLNAIAKDFNTKISAVAEGLFLTLAMRPVGAFLFGRMADRFGRRPTLMLNIISYSVFELASAFAPSFTVLLWLRAGFGIAMGGEWGVGAALAFETLPKEGRGFFSGLLQEGYVVGNLVAAATYGLLFRFIGWRGMFIVGAVPAFLVLYIRSQVDESPAWLRSRALPREKGHVSADVRTYLGSFLFLIVLMFAFNSFSHGTQDLYGTFLERNRGLSPQTAGLVGVIASIGALLGGILFGAWSERVGRRRAIVTAALLALPMIPLWAYSHSIPLIALGGFLMQFMVQGAWGIIPAHLNELSPPNVRATFPGLTYQLGNLLASKNQVIQARLVEQRFGGSYPPVLAGTVVIVATLVAAVTLLGKEAKGADLSGGAEPIPE
jgi:SHS family lactate transporter-like MFS transporter